MGASGRLEAVRKVSVLEAQRSSALSRRAQAVRLGNPRRHAGRTPSKKAARRGTASGQRATAVRLGNPVDTLAEGHKKPTYQVACGASAASISIDRFTSGLNPKLSPYVMPKSYRLNVPV